MQANEQGEVIHMEESERVIIANPEQKPIVWREIMKGLGLAGTPIGAKDLVGSTFTIYRAKQFKSTYSGQEHAWFCIVKVGDDPDPYSTVLGGAAVVEVLDAISKSGLDNPITVTLRFKEGGRYQGYYYFE